METPYRRTLNPANLGPSRIDRRGFLSTLAIGAGLSPFVSLTAGRDSGALDAQAPSRGANPAIVSTKRALTAADFTFLGSFRMPGGGGGVDTSFSYGGLAGRRVGGATHLFVNGSKNQNWPVWEIVEPGNYSKNLAASPHATLYASWGKPFAPKIQTFNSDGTQGTYPDVLQSLYCNPATGLLYATYFGSYGNGGTGYLDPSLVGASLDDPGTGKTTPYGPWRINASGTIGPRRAANVCAHGLDGSMMSGGTYISQNASNAWGPDLHGGGPWPTTSTPSGFRAPDIALPDTYITHYYPVGTFGTDGSVLAGQTIKSFRFPNADYIWHNDSPVGFADPSRNGGVGTWTEMDAQGAAIWLELPTKHGVLFCAGHAGGVGASVNNCVGHIWYATNATGQRWKCSHGCDSPTREGITGPVSTGYHPWWIIYNPDDLIAVKNRAATDYLTMPAASFDASATLGPFAYAHLSVIGAFYLGGFYFDPSRNYLFWALNQADDSTPGILQTVIHVFHVNG